MSEKGVVAIGPEGGEHAVRAERHHRILGELPAFEVVEPRTFAR